jgi:ubiquinone/menaquinone biosynthesis C-methylase UbiE
MIEGSDHQQSGASSDPLATALFQRQWQAYRKIIENNYTFHREAYHVLHRLLMDEAIQPFRFLDIACGDASASVNALKGAQVARYHGIDLSQAALDLAKPALKSLACPVILECRDFAAGLRGCVEAADVVWIGYSLHHLRAPAKLALMREIRAGVASHGLFVVCEPASPDDEDRDGWLLRYERLNKPLWTALTPEEWGALIVHVRAADFPETNSRWHSLGHEAGFAEVREMFAAPDDLHRMYCFRA